MAIRRACSLFSCLLVLWLIFACGCSAQEALPDIRSVAPDLVVPKLETRTPTPGVRAKVSIDENLYYVLYLPRNFDPSQRFPMIVEFAGNGGYKSPHGDESHGVPEGSNLGYGISGGEDFVWLCLPFVTQERDNKPAEVARQWWGSPPDFSPSPTVDLAKQVVESVAKQYSVDTSAVILAGFSRGAIACNLVGLHDDSIADLWCGMVVYSHYDGVRDWGLSGTSADDARERLTRLEDCPQFICHEGPDNPLKPKRGLAATRKYLEEANKRLAIEPKLTLVTTGFRNHNDAWVLRPSEARGQLREWLHEIEPVRQALSELRN